jgi:ankyrin repeat protein
MQRVVLGYARALSREERLRCAAAAGHVEVVRALLAEAGTDVNAADSIGWTALMRARATPSRRRAAVVALLEADPRVRR